MKRTRFAFICIVSLLLCSCGGISRDVKKGDIAGVQQYLANGGDINWKSQTGNTPIMMAASVPGNGKMVEFLCQKGADLNIRNMNGATALILATYYNHVDSVEALVKCKADKNIKDMFGHTALDYAEQYEYTRIIELLKD
jgi:ankyrin repeat protein